MELKTSLDDPLTILDSTREVMKDLKHISINKEALDELSVKIVERFSQGLENEYDLNIGTMSSLEDELQLIFIQNVVNFCFWPSMGEKKWEISYKGNTKSGWYGLTYCFKRGIESGIPITDASYLSNLTVEDATKFFIGENDTQIPLLKERLNNLREAGSVLLEHFGGNIIKLVELSNYDAIKICENIIKYFPSFRDVSEINNGVKFFKRAQICPNDFSYVLKGTSNEIKNLDKLTAYADYKLPQVLREFGILSYSQQLSEKVDSMTEIIHDSEEEVEIRASTVWAVELLRQHIGTLTAGEIDNTIWVISQGMQNNSKPYHRTRTIFY